jgi:hypothetical protein
VSHRDRPDILLCSKDVQVGIEITEAVPEGFAALCSFAEKEFPERAIHLGLFPLDAKPLSGDEMRDLLSGNAQSAGWVGNMPEREWAGFMNRVVKKKLLKLASDGFQLFDENWLIIYDNLPLPHVDLTEALEFLQPLLADMWTCSPTFDMLFFERGLVVAKLTADTVEYL